jgi:O-antigen/teichoic acid export membrane protein
LSLLKNSKYTLSANIVNQIFGMMIFLSVPNILDQGDYAKTVYISVLISFIVLFNLGMGLVYGRTMPSIYATKNDTNIEEFNQTFFWFQMIMGILGSIVISSIYFYKYPDLFVSALIFFITPFSLVIKFYITQYSVNENFIEYKRLNYIGAIARLITIPFSFVLGVGGWVLSQFIASFITLKLSKKPFLLNYNKFNLSLIKLHLKEGVILLATFLLWNQLLNSGRLFAAIYYDDIIIAQYGITNAGYMLLSSLFISIFLPVTVLVFKIMKDDARVAINQLFDTIVKLSFYLFIVVIMAIEFAPYLYNIFFPKYEINFDILTYQLLSLMSYPLIVTMGNVFIGLKQPVKLVFIYVISFFVSYLVMYLTYDTLGMLSASVAQLVGVTFMGILLLTSVVYFFGNKIDKKVYKFIKIMGVVYFPYIIYYLIRGNI